MSAPLRAAGLMALTWGTFWTTFGCRTSGIEFGYFLAWLPPEEPVENSWLANGILTAALHLTIPLFGLLLHRTHELDRGAPAEAALGGGALGAIAQLKVAFVLAFLLGFARRGDMIGPDVLSDALSEGGLWILALVAVSLPPAATSPEELSRHDERDEGSVPHTEKPPEASPSGGSPR